MLVLCHSSTKIRQFAPRVRKTVLMGYSETQKGYTLLNLESNAFLVSREVTLMEHIFPFKTNTGECKDLFMSPDSIGSVPSVLDDVPRAKPSSIDHTTQPDQVTIDALDIPIEQLPPDLMEGPTMVESTTNTIDDTDQAATLVDTAAEVTDIPNNTIPSENSSRPSRTLKILFGIKIMFCSTRLIQPAYIPLEIVYPTLILVLHIKTILLFFLVALEPSSFKDASRHEHWVEAMQAEMDALEQNKTWVMVDLPSGKRAIGSK
ncbi:uncharacterized protein LOC132066103 [Lycium ferocissimum]|uniref:uncharacterized protein LOC132066103 n=1 Tax=Lycium ferocissimum TaxID=112874 RepID=UPI002815741C|nr:uncharacterized protein LOC132066103 [Lycium ferocissimum]